MNQPPQPPSQPPQPARGYGYPQQPPAPPQPQAGVGGPQPVPGHVPPGQPPMGGQPMYPGGGWQGAPGQMPFPGGPMQQSQRGSSAGAFFLGLLTSFVVATLYTLLFAFTHADASRAVVNGFFFAHAVVNGAVVGWLVGLVGRRRTAAHVCGAVVAALGSFFGFANAMPVIIWKVAGFEAVFDMLKMNPNYPLEAWWGPDGTGHFVALLGLVVAAAAAWGVAFAVGRKRG
ncbi:hypothetical protein E4198_10365 [Streptomyces sp. RKND-216]|uniref:hypothetical protein n=1 Tax=Streptomyces sp. RKND-216 TaxID=2562581 RepID=UPI00109E1DC1|nr:hypothetical protein [Streptomyces sp. RKND-216]THA25079.1 hypothetical protein E4198_10365 [Streptomyces sp. RKND-216]